MKIIGVYTEMHVESAKETEIHIEQKAIFLVIQIADYVMIVMITLFRAVNCCR